MSHAQHFPRATWGFAGFIVGTFGLVAALLLVSGYFSEPEQSAAATIGQFAAEIRQSAKLALTGAEMPSAQPRGMDGNDYLALITPVIAAIAIILGGLSMHLNEPANLSKFAIGFGIAALTMQYVFWLAMLLCGMMLIYTVISNFGEILGD